MLAEACATVWSAASCRRACGRRRGVSRGRTGGPEVQALAFTIERSRSRCAGGARGRRAPRPHVPTLRLANPLTEAGQLLASPDRSSSRLERPERPPNCSRGLPAPRARAARRPRWCLPLCASPSSSSGEGAGAWRGRATSRRRSISRRRSRSPSLPRTPSSAARLAAATGDEAGCRNHAGRADATRQAPQEFGRLYVQAALGLLELALGRPETAISACFPPPSSRGHGVGEPNVVHWQVDLVEAYVRRASRRPRVSRSGS